MVVAGGTMTANELLRLPDDECRYALVRGELHRMTPAGFNHGAIVMRLGAPLAQHVSRHRLGVVCGAETGFVLRRRPDTVLAPDLSFVRRERIPASGEPVAFWDGAPDLAVEVVSPSDTRVQVAEKVAAWLGAGARLVWVVHPGQGSVAVHVPDAAPRRLASNDTLDGAPLLPDFRLPVAAILAP
ncbi:MAG: Uma2 family endonuclease [Acidobacteria bacterium]|nr:Uma2 family endonuclease [Acidobacteriota bacterium]